MVLCVLFFSFINLNIYAWKFNVKHWGWTDVELNINFLSCKCNRKFIEIKNKCSILIECNIYVMNHGNKYVYVCFVSKYLKVLKGVVKNWSKKYLCFCFNKLIKKKHSSSRGLCQCSILRFRYCPQRAKKITYLIGQ